MQLTKSNIELYAAKSYTHICCSTEEFIEDLKRVKRVKRLAKQYKQTGNMQVNNMLNNIRILFNVFEHHSMTNLLFMELQGFEDVLIPFLILLDFFPKEVSFNGKTIYTDSFGIDQIIVYELRKIIKG